MVNNTENNNPVALNGAEAAAEAMRQIEPGVVPVYPITPQTPIIERFAKMVASGEIKTEMITAESEHSVMSAAIGSAVAGSRTMTATSSVGLALMYEILNIASGMRVPIVMNVANRAISAPINIHCDHSDTMGVRDAGWIQIYSETAQEVYDHTILAVKLAEDKKVMLPAMVMQDGFITSHLMEKIETLSDYDVKNFVGKYKYSYSVFSGKKPKTFGPLVLPDYFFEIKHEQDQAMERARIVYKECAKELSGVAKREINELELFQIDEKTEAVIVTMSSAAGTAKEVAKRLAKKGQKVGVIKVRLFRPFPYEELFNAIKNITKIAVLDRAMSFGSVPALYGEVVQSLYQGRSRLGGRDDNQGVQSYIFGLGGRDLSEKDIKQVYTDLLAGNFSAKTRFLNLNK